ncbi:MAG: hypothetical protein WDW38_001222 [Sanguina aurantia]
MESSLGGLQTFVRLRDEKGKGALVQLDAVSQAVQIVSIPCPAGVHAQFALQFDLVGASSASSAQRFTQTPLLEPSLLYATTGSTRITDPYSSPYLAGAVGQGNEPGIDSELLLQHSLVNPPLPLYKTHSLQSNRSSSSRLPTQQPQQTQQQQATPPSPPEDGGLKRSSQPLSSQHQHQHLQQHSLAGSSGAWRSRGSLSSGMHTDHAAMCAELYGGSSFLGDISSSGPQPGTPRHPSASAAGPPQLPRSHSRSHLADALLSSEAPADATSLQADASAITLSFEEDGVSPPSPPPPTAHDSSPLLLEGNADDAMQPVPPPGSKKPGSGGLFARLFVASRRKVSDPDDPQPGSPLVAGAPAALQRAHTAPAPGNKGEKGKAARPGPAQPPQVLATAASDMGASGWEVFAGAGAVVDPLAIQLQQVLTFTQEKAGLDEMALAEVATRSLDTLTHPSWQLIVLVRCFPPRAATQVQYLLECLKGADRWLVPDCILQLKAEVNYPFDVGQPIVNPLEPSTPPHTQPQQLAPATSDPNAPASAVPNPGTASWFRLQVQQTDQLFESLRVCYAGVDQRGIGGPHACSAIVLEVCEWFLRAEEWSHRGMSASREAIFSPDSSVQMLQTLGCRRPTRHSQQPRSSGQPPAANSSSRRLQPAAPLSPASQSTHAIPCLTGDALSGCVRRGTALWKRLLDDPEAMQQASTSGDFELEEMLRVGGYGSRLSQAEYCAVSLAEPASAAVDHASPLPLAASPGPAGGVAQEGRGTPRHTSRQLSDEATATVTTPLASSSRRHYARQLSDEANAPATTPTPPPPPREGAQAGAGVESHAPHSNSGCLGPACTPPHRRSLTVHRQVPAPLATPTFLRGSSSASLASHFGKVSLGATDPPHHLRPSQRGPLHPTSSPSLARHSNASSSCSTQHLQRMRRLTADCANLPRFGRFMTALGPGCYVLGCHGHFSSIIVHASGDVLLVDSLGASLAPNCPHAFILHHASMAEFVAFFRARHQHKCDGHDDLGAAGEAGPAGEEGAWSGGDISSGNSAALVEVHHMQLSSH